MLFLSLWALVCYTLAVFVAIDKADNDRELSNAEVVLCLLAPISVPITIIQVLVEKD